MIMIQKDHNFDFLIPCVGTLCSKYVSDMRQKDNKVCWLFKSDGKCGSTELEPKYPFPPLDVPKFRWWECQNCLQGLCVKESRKLAFDNLNGGCNSDNPSCTHVALTGSETGKLVSEFKHILKLDNSAEKGEADADPLADQATATESHDLFCSNQKEERDYGSNSAVKGKISPGIANSVTFFNFLSGVIKCLSLGSTLLMCFQSFNYHKVSIITFPSLILVLWVCHDLELIWNL